MSNSKYNTCSVVLKSQLHVLSCIITSLNSHINLNLSVVFMEMQNISDANAIKRNALAFINIL